MARERGRGSRTWVWFVVVVVTLASAYYQRATGPTHAVRVNRAWKGETIHARLTRAHGGPGDQKIEIRGIGEGIRGDLLWRRYPTEEPFTRQPMAREGDRLTAFLPHQPPSGKLEYRLELNSQGSTLVVPESGPVVTRFKGHVPLLVLIPHVIFMFVGMLLSNRAGLGACFGDPKVRTYSRWTIGTLALGGLLLGPIVQKFAFGAFWTGVPFGWDLTDNKTLISVFGWAVALWAQRSDRRARAWTIAAALVTLIIFMIPHSLFGSELKIR
jgi:hypothetical protein